MFGMAGDRPPPVVAAPVPQDEGDDGDDTAPGADEKGCSPKTPLVVWPHKLLSRARNISFSSLQENLSRRKNRY